MFICIKWLNLQIKRSNESIIITTIIIPIFPMGKLRQKTQLAQVHPVSGRTCM